MIALFLISAATLLLEVVLTRIFSIYLWGHFAFLVVSLSLLGFGASGSVLHLWKRSVGAWRAMPLPSFILFFISAVAVYLGITRIPFDPVRIAWDPWQFLWLTLFYLFGAVPFFFSGLFIGSCFIQRPKKSARIYAINLIGSASGALLSLVLLNHLSLSPIRISPYKPLPQALLFPDSRILSTHWSVDGRVDFIQSGAVRFAPGLSLNFQGDLPDQIGITLDGDRLNAVTVGGAGFPSALRWKGTSPLQFLSYLPSSAPYSLLSEPQVLVVEGSGGLNILEALYHKAASVDVIERNRKIVALVDLYQHPQVTRVAGQVRHHLAHSDKKYDLISLSLSDSPGATSTGLYGLNENYLYTVEAFQEYLRHIRDGGLFTVTRYLLPPPREEPRTIALAIESLKSLKIQNPETHLALIESYGTWTLLMKKIPFTKAENEALRRFCDERGFTLSSVEANDPQESIFDLSPPTDDCPFFFHFFKISKLKETLKSLGGKWEAFFEGGYLVYFALALAIFWGLVLILAPVVIRRRFVGAGSPRPGAGTAPLRVCLYFFSIGLAFMFVEMAFLQKAIFLFGNPTYGFAILLAFLLLISGMGSATPLRIRPKILFPLIAAFILLSVLLKDPMASALLGIPIFYFMGIPFPSALSRIDGETIPLAWAVNGVASVLGAILAVIVALEWGYSKTLMGAGFLYLLSAFLFPPHLASGQTAHQSIVRS